ncbi:hypothetical protein H310_13306 [Aphanomyces invadans]|uniref:Uncharacterized protein n=1 Tax=Aphanomyces invadans TaxID=157072 RepID=A0A024TGI9_9STRA|nr:hypothetical protein H310_13306 [Aphanomyces invadans]ETV92427.1 hypothetical protein H310_13306 [Aphanomyces invadans]|eukprot:XP_008878978.1 hypothetical protein H310_13306 [Aphanomyces invadans]
MCELSDTTKRKPAYRFTNTADVDLLNEVVLVAPFDAGYGQTTARWDEIGDNMRSIHGEAITAICCRRRFDDLLAAFKKATLKALRSSGTEEEYNERDQLLQDIVDLIDAAATKKKALKQVQDKRETDGHLIREAALVSLKRKAVDDEVSPLKGAVANEKRLVTAVKEAASVVATFTEMMLESNKIKAEEVATKKEEIILAQQKLELERARYELDKAEREARFAVEKEREHN